MTPIFVGLGPLKQVAPRATAALPFGGVTLLFLTYLFKSADKEGSKTWTEEAEFVKSTVLHGGRWLRFGLCFLVTVSHVDSTNSMAQYNRPPRALDRMTIRPTLEIYFQAFQCQL